MCLYCSVKILQHCAECHCIQDYTSFHPGWAVIITILSHACIGNAENGTGGISLTLPQLPGASSSAPANRAIGNPAIVEPGSIMIDEPMHDAHNESSATNGYPSAPLFYSLICYKVGPESCPQS